MPRYAYHCEKCKGDFEYYHGMTEKKIECEVCKEPSLLKVPVFGGSIKKETQQKVGAIVDTYIEETRAEIRREKQEKKKLEYKPE